VYAATNRNITNNLRLVIIPNPDCNDH
jgi:hypothetical protein